MKAKARLAVKCVFQVPAIANFMLELFKRFLDRSSEPKYLNWCKGRMFLFFIGIHHKPHDFKDDKNVDICT